MKNINKEFYALSFLESFHLYYKISDFYILMLKFKIQDGNIFYYYLNGVESTLILDSPKNKLLFFVNTHDRKSK